MGLPTGRTPLLLYRELVRLCEAGQADFSRARTFNLDEFVGVEPSDRRSYRAFMERHLFEQINLPRARIHFLNGTARDLERECARYERQIATAGGLDLLLLGLGRNGHIGFNEPGASLVAPTHKAALTLTTRRANLSLFDHRLSAVPRYGLSMGMTAIMRARRIVLLVTGAGKAAMVRRLVHGPITPRVPASFLQMHPAAEVWVDRAAASQIACSS
jgi:glucosamine-6-phosphate deaminase